MSHPGRGVCDAIGLEALIGQEMFPASRLPHPTLNPHPHPALEARVYIDTPGLLSVKRKKEDWLP